jgi:protein AFG1
MRFVSTSSSLYHVSRVDSLIEIDESRCQVHLRAQSPLSDLFFPDAIPSSTSSAEADSNESIMAAEALSESLHQPSHPNISVYNPGERLIRERKEEVEGKRAGAFSVLGIWTGEDERFAYVGDFPD